MIVKIRWNCGWILYDDFDKVHYKFYSRENAEKENALVEWFELDEDKKFRTNKPLQSVLVLYCRTRDKSGSVDRKQVSIKTDCPVYLLNDEGKTIEKLTSD